EVEKKRAAYMVNGLRLAPPLLGRAVSQRRERLGALAGRNRHAGAAALRDAGRRFGITVPRLAVENLERLVSRQKERLDRTGRLLASYSYEAVLDRGFALVVGPDGGAVRSSAQVKTGDPLL